MMSNVKTAQYERHTHSVSAPVTRLSHGDTPSLRVRWLRKHDLDLSPSERSSTGPKNKVMRGGTLPSSPAKQSCGHLVS